MDEPEDLSIKNLRPVNRKQNSKYKPIKVRVLFLGRGNVGKTSLIRRLLGLEFDPCYKPTVYDVFKIGEEHDGRQILFEITDFAGVYSFPEMRRIAIKTNNIFVLVYNIEDEVSLHEVSKLKQELGQVPKIVVGNKSDSVESNLQEFVQGLSQKNSPCIVTSAKTGYNVPKLMEVLVREGEKLAPRKKKKFKVGFSDLI